MAISPQRLMIYLYSAHRAVIFATAQLSSYSYFDFYFNLMQMRSVILCNKRVCMYMYVCITLSISVITCLCLSKLTIGTFDSCLKKCIMPSTSITLQFVICLLQFSFKEWLWSIIICYSSDRLCSTSPWLSRCPAPCQTEPQTWKLLSDSWRYC